MSASGSRNGGFVLVGVVMLVLALTILGLSLFSLSSYESQFITISLDSEQAFHAAQGGIERAKYALSVLPNHLEQAKNAIPGLEFVTSAEATQLQAGEVKTTGPIDFSSGEPVVIKVTATYRGESKSVEGEFDATRPESYYKRLITSGDSIMVRKNVFYDGPGTELRKDMVHLTGGPRINFWQADDDTAEWTDNAAAYLPRGVLVRGVAPPPVGPFIAGHSSAPAPPRSIALNEVTVTLAGSPGAVTYYRSRDPSPDGHPEFSYHNETGKDLKILVGGLVVWMADAGLRSEGMARVGKIPGTVGPTCLVIVGGRNGRETFDPDAGIWFFGGFHSDDVPVVLASDGTIIIEHFNNQLPPDADDASIVNALSMYGRNIVLTGPLQGSVPTQLTYPQLQMDPLIDFLADQGALPGANASKVNFALRPGTWRASQP